MKSKWKGLCNAVKRAIAVTPVLAMLACAGNIQAAQAQGKVQPGQGQGKPNILFIMGDDIGWMQPSIYHRGLMLSLIHI